MALLTLVRHGQASYMAENYDRLSTLGECQARKLGHFWARHRLEFQQVFTGPASRHRRTCELAGEVVAAAGLPWPAPVVIDEFDEFDAGNVLNLYLPALVPHNERFATYTTGSALPARPLMQAASCNRSSRS